MSRAGNIAISILMWGAMAAYVVAATHYARERRASIVVESLRIAIADTTASRVITVEKVAGWLREAAINPIGRPVDSVGTRNIERLLAVRPEVKHVSAWSNLEGTLTIRLEPRTPAMRVRTSNGYRFWLTDDGCILPDRGDFTAHVPVVTGSVAFPFSPSAEGSYARMQAESYNDFYERFRALDARRRELSARLDSTRTEIRAVRASTPKRWWSESRKKIFSEGKVARIAELESGVGVIASSIVQIDKLERSLREKEKKSYQSYRFLSKLANFVEFIGRDGFWASQIVQINAVEGAAEVEKTDNPAGVENVMGTENTTDVTSPGQDVWREPQLELIPRVGDHLILLGELDGTERQRLENLRLFYLEGLWHEGWNAYGHINIKYGNQIVCTK